MPDKNIKMDKESYDRLAKTADKEGRTIKGQLKKILEFYFQKQTT